MIYSQYTQQQIIMLNQQGIKAPEIAKLLASKGTQVTRQGIHKFLYKFKTTGTIARRTGSGRL